VKGAARERVLVNVGCGLPEHSRLPRYFDSWRQLRVDIDPAMKPDIRADLTDLSPIADGTADAVWASHCLEHLYQHQVPVALKEFRRVLREDGFLCVIVPDLQAVAQHVAGDRLHEPLYASPAGPVTPHDMIYGYGAALAAGHASMGHRCGFTPGMLERCFQQAPFAEILLRRRSVHFELAAVARVAPAKDEAQRNALMTALEL
jgi:SAM-dependent methyltransferase